MSFTNDSNLAVNLSANSTIRPPQTSTISISGSAKLDVAYAYSAVGAGGMLSNLFIMFVVFTDQKMLKQSAMMMGICFSHLLCSVSIGVSGMYRVVNAATLGYAMTTWECMAMVFAPALPFAFQSMGFLLVLVGLERFAVFYFPNWYRLHCTNGKVWKFVACAYLAAIASFCVGLYFVSQQPLNTTAFCGFQAIFGQMYYAYWSVISASGGTIAVTLTVSGFVRGLKQAHGLPFSEASRHRRQLKLTRSLLSVAILDFCLVVIPNVLFVLSLWWPNLLKGLGNSVFSNFTNMTYCVNSMMTLFPYLAFNRAFRMRAAKMLKCKKQQTSSVLVVNNIVTVGGGKSEHQTHG